MGLVLTWARRGLPATVLTILLLLPLLALTGHPTTALGRKLPSPRLVFPPVSPWTVADALPPQSELPPAVERPAPEIEALLALVRDHRRSEGEPWRRDLVRTIYEESTAAKIDPLLVASIVATESSFRTEVVSRVGAVGLMQIRPFVGEDVARRGEFEWSGIETLYVPRMNLRLGITYFKQLLERFEGDRSVALTAYNYGPTRVQGWVEAGRFRGSDYAKKIIARYASLRGAVEDSIGDGPSRPAPVSSDQ